MYTKPAVTDAGHPVIKAAPNEHGLLRRDTTRSNFVPLTTTFTAPPECFNGMVTDLGAGDYVFNLAIEEAPGTSIGYSCYPPSYDTLSIVYSPGICPSGWVQLPDASSTRTFFPSVTSGEHAAYCCMRYEISFQFVGMAKTWNEPA